MSAVRQIVLDTETTGLDPAEGHRIIEIGCVELINRRRTRNDYQVYCHPERKIDEAALGVHGITNEFLADKPRFVEIVRDFLSYVKDAELIIHNAEFDTNFLNRELGRIGPELGTISEYCAVMDTLKLARQAHPGQRNDLDSLCQRYRIDNTRRTLHGAFLDAEILADVFLAMTGGQTALLLDNASPSTSSVLRPGETAPADTPLKVVYAGPEELEQHEKWLDQLDRESEGGCLWRRLDGWDDSAASR
ncbi:MAG: DNA polymerase III subunit epsilon [Gammaproteobacteria bacterium]|nr:DNA polymerase III subunit epsilon [Gammaproteobacteria bacterium]